MDGSNNIKLDSYKWPEQERYEPKPPPFVNPNTAYLPRNSSASDDQSIIERTDSRSRLTTDSDKKSRSSLVSPTQVKAKTMSDSIIQEVKKHVDNKHVNDDNSQCELNKTRSFVCSQDLLNIEEIFDSDLNNSELADLRSFVTNTFYQRKCNTFIEKKGNNDANNAPVCQCGRGIDWHQNMDTSEGKWDPDKHTELEKCSAFGSIQFSGFGKESGQSHAMYVRVEHQTKPEMLWELMEKYWKLPPPKMLISVTGGAKLSLKPRLKQSFKEGLINVTTSTGAWIVTGGTNAGVMALVGEAVNDYNQEAGAEDDKITCIGFATWGAIKNNKELESDARCPENGKFPAHYRKTEEKGAYLDNNHSHHILVDNGTINFGAEIKLRAAMEKYITTLNISSEAANKDDQVHVPIVLLVVDGGDNTLETVLQALRQETPVVVIGGSGRAANFIEIAMKMTTNSKNEEEPIIPKNFDEKMNTLALSLFEMIPNDARTAERQKKCMSSIEEIVNKYRQLVYVFKLDDGEGTKDIDRAILYALLRAKKSQVKTQLTLSLAWNRCDIAREEIFESENRKQPVEIAIMHNLLLPALLQDRVEFVKLFMEHGADIHSYIQPSELARLYRRMKGQESNNAAAWLFMTLIRRAQGKSAWQIKKKPAEENKLRILKLVGRVFDNLLGPEYKFYHHYKAIVKKETENRKDDKDIVKDEYEKQEFDPFRELFLWALVLGRKELALLFWKAGKDHIGAALIASALCKYLANMADGEEQIDLSAELAEMSEYFEHLAYGVLNECFKRDKDNTHMLLVRNLVTWQEQTLFSIAYSAEQLNFMGHTACQTKLNYIWRGKMTAYTSKLKIFGALFIPPLVWTIKFIGREDVDLMDGADERPDSNYNNRVSPTDTIVESPTHQEQTQKENRPSNICESPHLFYTAPIIKFSYDIVSQLVYLALFSYFVLVDLKPLNEGTKAPAITELVIWVWTFTLFLEQIRKIVVQEPENPFLKLMYYFEDKWAWFDAFMYLMFIISVILRCTLYGEDFVWTRIFYCSTLGLFYIHFMYAFYVERHIGPKVIIIQLMMMDLIFFALLWAIFLFAYGVAVEAIRLPGAGADWIRLERIIYTAYWQMFSALDSNIQMGIYDICGNSTDPDNIPPECQSQLWFIMIACAIYSLLTAILLLNMLIAMFSFTFGRVQDNSEKIWRFYRYGLIKDYFDRPALAPPLIIISHMWRFLAYFTQRCSENQRIGHDFHYMVSKDASKNSANSCIITPERYKQLTLFERSSMDNFMRSEELEESLKLDSQVSTASQRIDRVINQLELLKEQFTSSDGMELTESVGKGANKSTTDSQLRTQMAEMQDQIYLQQQQLNVIINMLKSSDKKTRKSKQTVEISDRAEEETTS